MDHSLPLYSAFNAFYGPGDSHFFIQLVLSDSIVASNQLCSQPQSCTVPICRTCDLISYTLIYNFCPSENGPPRIREAPAELVPILCAKMDNAHS